MFLLAVTRCNFPGCIDNFNLVIFWFFLWVVLLRNHYSLFVCAVFVSLPFSPYLCIFSPLTFLLCWLTVWHTDIRDSAAYLMRTVINNRNRPLNMSIMTYFFPQTSLLLKIVDSLLVFLYLMCLSWKPLYSLAVKYKLKALLIRHWLGLQVSAGINTQ